MRSDNGWHQALSRELADAWPADLGDFPAAAMLGVELGLYLLSQVMPGRPARDAWTLFGGYPYAEATGHARTDEPAAARSAAPATTCGPMRRRRVWLTHLDRYRPRARRSCAATCWTAPTTRPRAGRPARAAGAVREVRGAAHLPAGVRPPGHPARDGRRVPVPGPRPQPLGHLHAGAGRRPRPRSRTTWTPERPRAGASRSLSPGTSCRPRRAQMDEAKSPPLPASRQRRLGGPAAPRRAARPAAGRLRAGRSRCASTACCTWSAWSARARARCATSSPTGS